MQEFLNEFWMAYNAVLVNDALQAELKASLINVSAVMLLTFVGLKYKIVQNLFSVHEYSGEPKNSKQRWHVYRSAPLLSANGICMWRILLSLPLGLASIVFYHDSEASFLIFQVYVFLFSTDALDGEVARRLGNVTNIGKVLDPLGDKILDLIILLIVCSFSGNIYFMVATFAIVILDILGQYIRGKSINPAASWVGKSKTILKVITIYVISLNRHDLHFDYIGTILMTGTLLLTYWSFHGKLSPMMKKRSIDYIRRFSKKAKASVFA